MDLEEAAAPRSDHQGHAPTTTRTRSLSHRQVLLVGALPVLLGSAAAALFLGFGISVMNDEQQQNFERRASELVQELKTRFDEYQVAVLTFYQSCRNRNITRVQVREAYEHIIAPGLAVRAIGCVYNLSHAERIEAETEGREYYSQHYPYIAYQGFTGLEPNTTTGELTLQYRSAQPFYFPVRYMEPVEGNEAALDFDLYSFGSRRATIEHALDTWEPAMTERIRLVQEKEQSAPAFSVLLLHPGIPLTTQRNLRPRDLASVVIRIPDLLQRSQFFQLGFDVSAYLFDSSDKSQEPVFMGGSQISNGRRQVSVLIPEVSMAQLRQNSQLYYQESSQFASREWTVVVVPSPGAYQADLLFVIFGGIMIIIVAGFLAMFVSFAVKRMRAQAEAEKTSLLIASARASAQKEREFNDFVAHEVRNPLSAALSAMTFVTAAIQDRESLETIREDLGIVSRSLHFINDLLRSMLDVHRACSDQMKIDKAPTDLRRDVLEPVQSMFYTRGDDFVISVDCPADLVIETDKLRLSQVMLNLGRNSTKFVHTGFVRFRAFVEEENVHLCVEDSGTGIPEHKRDILFQKFQESLDTLNQGTGIGLCLVKQLVELMGAEIWLDESFDSGIPDYPGTRFVICLNTAPVQLDSRALLDTYESRTQATTFSKSCESFTSPLSDTEVVNSKDYLVEASQQSQLPENLSVLFVDDDIILRKLFSRAIQRVAPTWKIQEVASGEAALSLVEFFDIIFLDMYMASVEKQLLGTETVVALRSKGVDSIICGLSANDMESSFLASGADYFILKPIPSKEEPLRRVLLRIINGGRRKSHVKLAEKQDGSAQCKSVELC